MLFENGVCPHTVFAIPQDAKEYPVVLLSSVAGMTEEEKAAAYRYLAAGGKLVVTGPSALKECKNTWALPNRLDVAPEEFFTTVPDGIHVEQPDWAIKTDVEPSDDPDAWTEPVPGLYYHPHRIGKTNKAQILKLCRDYMKPM